MVAIEVYPGFWLSRPFGLWLSNSNGKYRLAFTMRGAGKHLVDHLLAEDAKE